MADKSVRVVLSASVGAYRAAMEQAATSTRRVGDAAERLSRSDSWRGFERGAMVASVAVVGAVGAMVGKYAEFDQAMSQVAAATNASAGDLDKLRQAAMDAGAQFGQFSSTDAAGALEELGKAGLSTSESIAALTGTMGLAAADGMAVADAATLTADALNMFGMAGSEAETVANLLAQGAGAASGSARDLGQALSQVGAVAASTGMSMQDTTTALALFASNGIKGSDAGTSLKTMLMSLANPSKKAAATMDELGIAAFDAQGSFVGMRSLSEQLQTKLQGLTTEQKNAALATMFGSDAMRVAAILAKEGGQGYDEMAASMAGFGSAADVAAKRTDNLRGDLAELSGSWENLMISMGGSANGPLREVVQGLTGLTDFASRHQTLVAVLGGIAAGLVGIGAAAVVTVRTVNTIRDLHDTVKVAKAGFDAFAQSHPKVAGGLRDVGRAAGVAVVGFGALTVAGAAYQASIDKSLKSSEELSAELLKLGKGGDMSGINAEVAKLGGSMKDLGSAMSYVDGKGDWTDRLGSRMGRATPSVLGMKSAYAKYAEQIDKVDKSLASLDAAAAANAFNAFVRLTGVSAQDAGRHFDTYRNKLQGIANDLNVTVSEDEMVAWMGGKVPASIRKAAAAAEAGGKSVADLAGETKKGADAAKEAAEAADKQRDSYFALANAALQLSGSEMGYQAALDDATKALKENGRTLDINTEAGRANRTALDNVASSHLKAMESAAANGASTEELTRKTRAARQQFIDMAVRMGMTAAQAQALADQYGLIPDSVMTTFGVPGAIPSKADVAALHAEIDAMPKSQQTKFQALLDKEGYAATRAALDRLARNRTVYIDAQFSGNWVEAKQKSAPKGGPGLPTMRASGGPVWGSGTSTSDSIPAMLSDGEFVIKTASARKLGYSWLEHLNRLGEVPRYADGGRVAYQAAPARLSYSVPTPSVTPAPTFAPVLHAHGPDAREVASHAMSMFRHEARDMAASFPGGGGR